MREKTDGSIDAVLVERAERLKDAVRRAGGTAVVVRATNMPTPTLNNYLSGRDMKVSALVTLADATNVSVEWLATGRGDRAPSSPVQSDLFDASILDAPVHFWGLFVAIRSAREWFEKSGVRPTLRELFMWIGGPYRASVNLPDRPIDFLEPHAERGPAM
jgi:hypothetical protein